MVRRKGNREGHMEDGNVGNGAKGGVLGGELRQWECGYGA